MQQKPYSRNLAADTAEETALTFLAAVRHDQGHIQRVHEARQLREGGGVARDDGGGGRV